MRFLLLRMLPVAMAALALVSSPAFGQAYPTKPIRLVVPFPPGGSLDVIARAIGQKLSEAWGQPIIVDNRPGAGGNIAAEVVAKSAPDGYTLFMASNSFAINPSLYSKLPFDPINDFAPITFVGSVTNVLIAHPSLPARSIKELIALAKAKPGQITYASAGVGTSPHLAVELFKGLAKVDLTHVAYKGVPQLVQAVLSGEVALGSASLPSAGIPELIKAGRLRGLALTGAKRSKAAPNVPTMSESGFPGYDVVIWFGLYAPAGTPQDVIAKLNQETIRILSLPAVRERLATHDFDIQTSSPAEFGAYTKREIAQWAKVIREAGIKIE